MADNTQKGTRKLTLKTLSIALEELQEKYTELEGTLASVEDDVEDKIDESQVYDIVEDKVSELDFEDDIQSLKDSVDELDKKSQKDIYKEVFQEVMTILLRKKQDE